MNFDLTDDRRMLADMLDRFLKEQYPFETRQAICRSPEGHSAAVWQQFAELGVIGAMFEEGDGGLGGAGFDLMVVFEALGRGLAVEPLLDCAVLAGSAVARAGNETQRAMLAAVIDGTVRLAFAHVEPEAGDALTDVATRARRAGDTGWVLNGTKALVYQAEAADCFVVSARTAGQVGDTDGLSLFLVPAQAPGLSLRSYPLVDGGRAAEVSLHDVALPDNALLGAAGAQFETLEHCVGRGLLALCAEALGAMDACKEATLDYLRTRQQFGVPLGSFQALQHRMADLLLDIEQARSAVINAAAALDGDRLARERALSAAKMTIGATGTRVAEECIQLHGGIGMTWELPLAHYAKRLVMINHQFGDEDFHLQRYIALDG